MAALESAGIIFIAENGDGPGVRLRKAPAQATDARGPATDAVLAKDAAINKHEAAGAATRAGRRNPGGRTPKKR